MTITEFLEARIAEDEARAQAALGWVANGPEPRFPWFGSPGEVTGPRFGAGLPHIAAMSPGRALAECAAKRAVLADRKRSDSSMNDDEWTMGYSDANYDALHALAVVYKYHPDYRQEWTL